MKHHRQKPNLAPPFFTKAFSSRRLLRASLFVSAASCVGFAQAQAIYNASEQAWAGSSISVQGDALDANAQFVVYPYSSNGTRLSGVTVLPTNASGQVATVKLPSNLGAGVYEIAANTTKGTTNSVFVNRPRLQWADVSEAMPGNTVRIIGRNLNPIASVIPTVTLTNVNTKAAYTATIVKAEDNCVSFSVPASTPVGSYAVSLNNNLSGSISAGATTLTLGVVAKADDPFNLGVSWGGEFAPIAKNIYNIKTDPRLPYHAAGDGVTDDTNAFRWAIVTAGNAGGGVVYAPAGTYRVDDGGLLPIYATTVLRGEGKGKTVLQVGYRFTPSHAPTGSDYYPILIWGSGSSVAGIADLTIENLNTNPTPNNVFGGGQYWSTTGKSFVKNVEMRLNNGTAATMFHPRKFVWADSDITTTGTWQPIRVTDAQEFQFLRNNVNYHMGRLTFDYGLHNVFEGNHIAFDNASRTPSSRETGGIELGCGQGILLRGNDLAATGAPATKADLDGEMIMTQYGMLWDFNYVGMVRSATSRILVPTTPWSTTTWNGDTSALQRTYVAIIAGKGMGQWRWVTTQSKSALMVDRPWQIVPDATSRYSIGSMTNYQQTYIDNTISGSCTGIDMWDGAVDTTVANNVLTNTGTILFRGDSIQGDRVGASPGSNVMFNLCWNDLIANNTLVNSSGYRPACISLTSQDEAYAGYGTMMLGIDVRNNKLSGSFTNTGSFYSPADGIQILDDCHSSVDSIASLGTTVQNNSVTGSLWGPIYFNPVAPSFGAFDNIAVTLPSKL